MRQETRNYGRFYALLSKLPHEGDREELKRDIVMQYTGNRTESLREMIGREYNAMCAGLADASGEAVRRQQQRDDLRRQRSVCLRLMQKLGIDTSDWARVNDFCKNPRIAGKVFAGITAGELEKLAVKLRAIQRGGGLRKRETPEGRGPVEMSADDLELLAGRWQEMQREKKKPRGRVVCMYGGGGLGDC